MQNDIRIELEDLSSVKKKLNITISAEAVKKEIKEAYNSLKSTASIAGFRKGNIPMSILKARFGDYVREEVTKKVIETSYPKALKEKEIVPVESPKVDIITPKLEETSDFAYTVEVEINPQVDITDYKGLGLQKNPIEVTEQDLELGLRSLRESRAQFREVERPAGEGDFVVLDFEASVGEGAPIKSNKATDFTTIVGKETVLPGFDEALKGMSKGEHKDAKLTFPESYSEGGLGGKEVTFHITMKAVKEKHVPEIDDEFAKDLACDNLETLKTRVKEELTKAKESNEKERLKNIILDRLIEKHPFEVPDALVKRYQTLLLNKVIEQMRAGNVNPEDQKMTPDELNAKYLVLAQRSVKEDIILDAIAQKENVQVSPQETEEAVKELAESRGITFEALMTRIQREGALEVIKDGLKHEKVFDIIIESSTTAA